MRTRTIVIRRIVCGVTAIVVAASTAVGAAPASAAAPTAQSVAQPSASGWVEGAGTSGAVTSPLGARAVNHRGRAESKIIGGTTHKRSHGWTTWAGVRHYTTAQLEHYWPASGVIASSGRQWGTGGTEAVSPWRASNPAAPSNGNGIAKTYYGR